MYNIREQGRLETSVNLNVTLFTRDTDSHAV